MKFQDVSRIGREDKPTSGIGISGRNIGFDLDTTFRQWLKEEMKMNHRTGDWIIPDPLTFCILYRDHHNNWYKSHCEIGRDVLQFSDGFYLKFLSQEKVAGPSPTS